MNKKKWPTSAGHTDALAKKDPKTGQYPNRVRLEDELEFEGLYPSRLSAASRANLTVLLAQITGASGNNGSAMLSVLFAQEGNKKERQERREKASKAEKG